MRNALIANFNPLALRQDVSPLWENFMISERKKYLDYHKVYGNLYFWRNHDQQEIDLIEERGGQLYAYELKWNPKAKYKFPNGFMKAYENKTYDIITPKNMEAYLL